MFALVLRSNHRAFYFAESPKTKPFSNRSIAEVWKGEEEGRKKDGRKEGKDRKEGRMDGWMEGRKDGKKACMKEGRNDGRKEGIHAHTCVRTYTAL
jgi:hypothetical protein